MSHIRPQGVQSVYSAPRFVENPNLVLKRRRLAAKQAKPKLWAAYPYDPLGNAKANKFSRVYNYTTNEEAFATYVMPFLQKDENNYPRPKYYEK